jgi:hypothetical protein
MPNLRRVVQITGLRDTIAAVCDDGSVWLLVIDFDEGFSKRRWVQAPDIPQPRDVAGAFKIEVAPRRSRTSSGKRS